MTLVRKYKKVILYWCGQSAGKFTFYSNVMTDISDLHPKHPKGICQHRFLCEANPEGCKVWAQGVALLGC